MTLPLLGIGGCEPRAETPDPRVSRVAAGVNAALEAGDPVRAAETFVDAAHLLKELQGACDLSAGSSTDSRAAASIAEQMLNLLRSDTRGIVAHLETVDPTGRAITPWTRCMLSTGNAEALHTVLAELWRGPDGAPLDHLADHKAAVDLGYLMGSVIFSMQSTMAGADDAASLLQALIGSETPDGQRAGALLSLAGEQEIDAAVGRVRSGGDAPEAFYILMVAELPANTQHKIDTAMNRVIRWRRLDR